MSGGTVGIFVFSLVFGILLFVGCLLMFIFRGVRAAAVRQRAELEGEGVVLDSGRVPVVLHFRGFRAQGMYVGVGANRGTMQMVLTKRRLVFVPSRRSFLRIDRADLNRYAASVEDGALRLHSEDPPNASGSIDFRISVSDPAAWLRALTEAGAKS